MICHLKVIFVWILLVPQLTDGGSVTWYEPTPAKTTSDQTEVLPPGKLQVYEGSSAVLQWNYSLTSNFAIAFIKFKGATVVTILSDGKAGEVSSNFTERFSVLSSTKQTASLSISRVIFADDKANGEFTCEVATSNSERWKRAIQVQVLAPVKITDQVRGDQVVPKGGNLHLFCKVTGRPAPNVNWTKVPADGSNEIKHYGPTWNFTNINVTDSGTYSCVADNKVEDPKRGQEVNVIVTAPVDIPDMQMVLIVTVEESVTLSCEAKGNPPPSYTWTPCSQDQVCDKSTFVIQQINKDANYTCKAANEYTNDSKSYSVFIGGTVINITLVITSESCTADKEYDPSTLFKKLSETFDVVFAIKFGYENVKLIDVRCGSIEVDLALHFNSTTKEKDVITELRNAVKDGKFGEFNVSAVVGTRRDFGGPTTKEPTTTKGSSNTAAIVGGSVGGALLCLGAGAGGVVYYKKKQDEKKKKGKNQRVDTSGGQGRRDGDQEAGYDNNYADVGPGANCPRKGGNVRNEQGIPEYAVVDKTKKKKKTPKPGEPQYAELGELTVPERKATMPRVSGTDTVYADVRS